MNAHDRRRAWRAWKRAALAYTFAECDALPAEEAIPRAAFLQLPDYTLTIPTGAGPGRRWRGSLLQRVWRARGVAPRTTRPQRWMVRRKLDVWTLALVLNEPHPEGGFRIRWTLARTT